MPQPAKKRRGLRQVKPAELSYGKNGFMRILLAEDDQSLGQALADGLRLLGYAVDWITDGSHAAAAMNNTNYAAAIVDWNLPHSRGATIVAGMRRLQHAPPMMLLSGGDALADREAGPDTRVDDYVVKPLHLDELAARLRALLRRSGGQVEPPIRLGTLEVRPVARSATLAGATLELTAREYALLETLVRQPGRAYSRDQLEDALCGREPELDCNAVEVHLHHLRHKLGPGWIRTSRGIGYAICAPVAEPVSCVPH